MKIIHEARIDEDGKLVFFDLPYFRNYIQQFKGMAVQFWIGKAEKIRSNAQNRYLWGVAYKTISDALGWDADDVHEFCKKEFNPKFITITNLKTGEATEKVIAGSTKKMTTVAFMEYVEKIQRFFAEYGVVIADPNQIDFLEETA